MFECLRIETQLCGPAHRKGGGCCPSLPNQAFCLLVVSCYVWNNNLPSFCVLGLKTWGTMPSFSTHSGRPGTLETLQVNTSVQAINMPSPFTDWRLSSYECVTWTLRDDHALPVTFLVSCIVLQPMAHCSVVSSMTLRLGGPRSRPLCLYSTLHSRVLCGRAHVAWAGINGSHFYQSAFVWHSYHLCAAHSMTSLYEVQLYYFTRLVC